MKKIFIFMATMTLILQGRGQHPSTDSLIYLLQQNNPDSVKARLLMQLADVYWENPK